jgi:hypothetical protein
MNIADKIEGSSYTPAEWNQFKNEIMNIQTSSGQANASNSVQLKQAVARYVANSSSYTDSGIADAYSLTEIGSNDKPSAYLDGITARFLAGNTNTGASTLAISGLATKSIKKNGFVDALDAGDIVAGQLYMAYYSLSDDEWELTSLNFSTGGGGGGGFGINENTQSGAYSLLTTDYGVDNDKTVVYTGTGGHAFTGITSASLTAGESYTYIEHRGAGLLTVDLANASDYFGPLALAVNTITLSAGEVVRIQLTATTNVFRVG